MTLQTKKFYEARNELKKLMDIVKKQNIKLKQYEKRIEYLESERINNSSQYFKVNDTKKIFL